MVDSCRGMQALEEQKRGSEPTAKPPNNSYLYLAAHRAAEANISAAALTSIFAEYAAGSRRPAGSPAALYQVSQNQRHIISQHPGISCQPKIYAAGSYNIERRQLYARLIILLAAAN